MKRLLIGLLLIGFTSCNKEKEVDCNLSKGDQAVVEMPIIFTASEDGDGVISSLTYKVGDTQETITSPYLPWTITIDATEGDDILITATGTVKNGSIKITYEGKSGGIEIAGSDDCSNYYD